MKITTKFMLAVALVGSLGLSSCKDYDEDNYANAVTAMNKSQQSLEDQIATLKQAIADLEAAKCTCDQSKMVTIDQVDQEINKSLQNGAIGQAINALKGQLDDYAKLQTLKDTLNSYYTISQVDQAIQNLGLDKYAQKTDLDNYVTNNSLAVTLQDYVKSSELGGYVSKTEYEEYKAHATDTLAVYMKTSDAENTFVKKSDIKDWVETSTYNTFVTETNTKITEAKNLAQQALDKANSVATDLQNLIDGQVKTNKDSIAILNTQMTEANQKISSLEDAISKIKSCECEELKSKVTALSVSVDSLKSVAKTSRDSIQVLDSIIKVIQATQPTIDLSNYYNKQEIEAKADTLKYCIELLSKHEVACDSLYKEAMQKVNDELANKANKSDLDAKADKTDLTALQTALENADKALENKIKDLSDKVDAIDARLTTVEKNLASLQNKVDALAKQVTGIITQQVWNPMFGSYNSLLTNVSTNILVAFYNEGVASGAFPTTKADVYGTQGQVKTGQEKVSYGGTMLCDEGNAGKVYLTVNPAEVDFTGLNVSLVNSQDVKSAVSLSPLAKSSETLKFGYTRATANFYETAATINEASIKNGALHLDFDKSKVKDAYNDFINTKREEGKKAAVKVLIKDVAQIGANAVQALNMEALGAKATYTDVNGEHAIVSNYGIAAVALKPLNFTTFDTLQDKELEYYNKAIKFMRKTYEKVADKIVNKINEQLDKKAAKLEQRGIINVQNISGEGGGVLVTISYEGSDAVKTAINEMVAAGRGEIVSHDAENKQFVVKYTLEDMRDIVDVVADNDVKNITDMINDLIDQIRTYDEKLADPYNKYVNKVVSYLDKINNKVYNAIPRLLKPILLINSDKGFNRAGVIGAPCEASGTVTLYPTTYTAELIAPIFKKYIWVEETGFSHVYDGADEAGKKIQITLNKGYNTIHYQAIDFSGNIIAQTYSVYYE